MKKVNRRELLLSGFAGLVLSACGGGGSSLYTPPPANETPAPAVETEPITLVSSQKMSDLRWQYVLAVDSVAIPGSKASPFCFGEHNGWRLEAMTDINTDGKYEVIITSYNRVVKLAFGGDYSANSWMDVRLSKYVVREDDGALALYIAFNEGSIYKKGEAVFAPMPGLFGDSFVRFTPSANQITVYVNNNQFNDVVDAPFIDGTMTNWLPVSQVINGSSGWGSISIPVTAYSFDMTFGYGLNFAKNRWVSAISSRYRDPAGNFHANVTMTGASNP